MILTYASITTFVKWHFIHEIDMGLTQEMSAECKLRLLMIFAATRPEKLDANKRKQWQQVHGGLDTYSFQLLQYFESSVIASLALHVSLLLSSAYDFIKFADVFTFGNCAASEVE